MKCTIATFATACFLSYSICSCKNDDAHKVKSEEEIYSGIEKSIDTFLIESASTFSLSRIKKVAERIGKIGLSEELVLDTLPNNSQLTCKTINGKFRIYLKDSVSETELYSLIKGKESIRPELVAIESFEGMRRRNCKHWREVCNNPELTFTNEHKRLCKLYLTFYCN